MNCVLTSAGINKKMVESFERFQEQNPDLEMEGHYTIDLFGRLAKRIPFRNPKPVVRGADVSIQFKSHFRWNGVDFVEEC